MQRNGRTNWQVICYYRKFEPLSLNQPCRCVIQVVFVSFVGVRVSTWISDEAQHDCLISFKTIEASHYRIHPHHENLSYETKPSQSTKLIVAQSHLTRWKEVFLYSLVIESYKHQSITKQLLKCLVFNIRQRCKILIHQKLQCQYVISRKIRCFVIWWWWHRDLFWIL